MAHQVFICHSSKDRKVAGAVCVALEKQKIPCWIAPRDVLIGTEYMKAIGDALAECEIVVLVLSRDANDSPIVRKELERAVNWKKTIVPFLIEDFKPTRDMELMIGNTQFLEAFVPPLERHLPQLCASSRRLLDRKKAAEPTEARPVPAPQNSPKPAEPQPVVPPTPKRPEGGPIAGPAQKQAGFNTVSREPAIPARRPDPAASGTQPRPAIAPLRQSSDKPLTWTTTLAQPRPAVVPASPVGAAQRKTATPVPGRAVRGIASPQGWRASWLAYLASLALLGILFVARGLLSLLEKVLSTKGSRALFAGWGAVIAALAALGWVGGMSSYAWAIFLAGAILLAGFLLVQVRDWLFGGFWKTVAWAALGFGAYFLLLSSAVNPLTLVFGAYTGWSKKADSSVGWEYTAGDGGWKGLHRPGFAPNPARAEYFLRRACAAGISDGCQGLAALGDRFRDGNGVPKDAAHSAALYKLSCDGNYTGGCVDLGYAYDTGLGVKKDPAAGAAVYQRACTGGNANGCFDLAWGYESGDGVVPNFPTAASLYKGACDGGSFDACTNLGVFYDSGKGVGRDPNQAHALFKKACDGGDAHGCSDQGLQAWYGNGIAQDKARGRELLQKGCRMGDSWGCDRLKETQ